MRIQRSRKLMKRARAVIPGGVNSPVRAFGSVGGTPRFIKQATGARVEDEDGNRYIDYVASWGPIIVGHAHPMVVEAVRSAAARGTSFGAPTEAEVLLAERVTELVPSVEMLRLVNSGTEAVMSALRLARGATGRDKIIKFAGCYHGHPDAMLVAAGSGIATLGIPGTDGVPRSAVADTIVVPYNDLDAVESVFVDASDEIAAIIVEPVAANMGMVRPQPKFLRGLREVCDTYGSLLIFDEVITGFRVGLSGAQGRLEVTPDLSTFGKIIGGGLPVGAYGGKRSLMRKIAPEGPIFQAGTLSGNPLTTAAGLAVLDLLSREGTFERLEATSRSLAQGLQKLADEVEIPFVSDFMGGIVGFLFRSDPPRTYEDVRAADHEHYKQFFQAMLEQGVYLAPSGYEVAFLTTAHGEEEIELTLAAARKAFKKVA